MMKPPTFLEKEKENTNHHDLSNKFLKSLIKKKSLPMCQSQSIQTDDWNSEILEKNHRLESQLKVYESDIDKLRFENLKLEKTLKTLQESLALRGQHQNNTSSGFSLPSEFRNTWDLLIKDLLASLFCNFLSNPLIYVNLIQDLLKTIEDFADVQIQNKTKAISKELNLNGKEQEVYNTLLNLYQDEHSRVFQLGNEELKGIIEDFKGKAKEALEFQYGSFEMNHLGDNPDIPRVDLTGTEIEELTDNSDFNRLITLYHGLSLYMKLNDPPLKTGLEDFAKRRFGYVLFKKSEFYCIDGFVKENAAAIVVIPAVKRGNFVYNGMKPAVLMLGKELAGKNTIKTIIETLKANMEANNERREASLERKEIYQEKKGNENMEEENKEKNKKIHNEKNETIHEKKEFQNEVKEKNIENEGNNNEFSNIKVEKNNEVIKENNNENKWKKEIKEGIKEAVVIENIINKENKPSPKKLLEENSHILAVPEIQKPVQEIQNNQKNEVANPVNCEPEAKPETKNNNNTIYQIDFFQKPLEQSSNPPNPLETTIKIKKFEELSHKLSRCSKAKTFNHISYTERGDYHNPQDKNTGKSLLEQEKSPQSSRTNLRNSPLKPSIPIPHKHQKKWSPVEFKSAISSISNNNKNLLKEVLELKNHRANLDTFKQNLAKSTLRDSFDQKNQERKKKKRIISDLSDDSSSFSDNFSYPNEKNGQKTGKFHSITHISSIKPASHDLPRDKESFNKRKSTVKPDSKDPSSENAIYYFGQPRRKTDNKGRLEFFLKEDLKNTIISLKNSIEMTRNQENMTLKQKWKEAQEKSLERAGKIVNQAKKLKTTAELSQFIEENLDKNKGKRQINNFIDEVKPGLLRKKPNNSFVSSGSASFNANSNGNNNHKSLAEKLKKEILSMNELENTASYKLTTVSKKKEKEENKSFITTNHNTIRNDSKEKRSISVRRTLNCLLETMSSEEEENKGHMQRKSLNPGSLEIKEGSLNKNGNCRSFERKDIEKIYKEYKSRKI